MELVWAPSGEFMLGSDTVLDSEASSDEEPQHLVNLPEFYMGRYEVTNAQYAAFAAATGYALPESWPNRRILPGKEDHPVVDVSWYDAVAFAQWLSGASGLDCRLPTEAEWEKACRGVDERIYPWGNAPRRSDLANYGGSLMETTPVGSYSPQGDGAYGAADMVGNVWEWTSSLHIPYPYDAQDGREDPASTAPRVMRGGSFWDESDTGRCANRGDWASAEYDYRLGFRVLCAQPPADTGALGS
jgi:formylglycine-generating enzyme required for sulfatase activity